MEKRILTYRHFMDELIKEILEKHDKSKEELELIRQEHLTQASGFRFAPYARILGFQKKAAPL